MGQKPNPRERRRKEILDAAFKEFAENGYAGASMEAIARRAHASKETLYAWFENKESLFDALYLERLTSLQTRIIPAAERDPSPHNVLPIIAEDVIRLLLAIAPLSQAIFGGGAGHKARRLIGRTISEERKNFVDYLLWCRKQGFIAFDDDPFEIASLFVSMAQGEWALRLATGMLVKVTDAMIVAHARRVSAVFLKGLAPGRTRGVQLRTNPSSG